MPPMCVPMSQSARLDVMDEVLLADRFAASLAAAPAVSCAVPLPPTMPAVKISANGLPMPIRLESEAPLFQRTYLGGPASRPRSANTAGVGVSGRKLLDNSDVEELEANEVATLSGSLLQLRAEYNRTRQVSAAREEKLERLQVRATLGARDGRDTADELEYMRALRAATEAELGRVAERTLDEEHTTDQHQFVASRLVGEIRQHKRHVAVRPPPPRSAPRHAPCGPLRSSIVAVRALWHRISSSSWRRRSARRRRPRAARPSWRTRPRRQHVNTRCSAST